MVKNLPAKQEMWAQFLGRENPLEEETATHSNILAWETPWTESDKIKQLNNNNPISNSLDQKVHIFLWAASVVATESAFSTRVKVSDHSLTYNLLLIGEVGPCQRKQILNQEDPPVRPFLYFPGGSDGKASAYNVGDPGSVPESGRSGEGNGNPLQYFCPTLPKKGAQRNI